MGSVFFAGTEKTPLALSAFFVDSHQRFHSVSVKTSPTSHSLICCAVALPSRLSRIFRTSAAGSFFAKVLIAARSVALRARKCSGASGMTFSAAYWACIGCDFLPAKSITIWLSSRFHSLTRPNPQLLAKQNAPGFSFSSCCAAWGVSLPASTSFSNSASMCETITNRSYPPRMQFIRLLHCRGCHVEPFGFAQDRLRETSLIVGLGFSREDIRSSSLRSE